VRVGVQVILDVVGGASQQNEAAIEPSAERRRDRGRFNDDARLRLIVEGVFQAADIGMHPASGAHAAKNTEARIAAGF
jgi:hypothetical protein